MTTENAGVGLALDDAVRKARTTSRRAAVAAVLGNMLESYDFAVYAFFAIIISRLFFPAGDESVSLLITVATFGVGFVARPIGAILLGSVADRHGRKFALSFTILLMAIGTAMIGLAPTYAQIGIWAPIIIVTARLIQGFSAGGEVGTATAFLVEHAPPGRRGFLASWQQASQACALLIGSLVGAALTGMLSPVSLEAWGWRVPFLIGLLIGPVGYYIRKHTEEGEEYRKTAVESLPKRPVASALMNHGREVFAGFGITITWTVCTYFFLIYMPTYAVRQLQIPQSTAFTVNSIALALLLVLAPMFGALSDRIGRRPLLLGSALAIVILTYPALSWLASSPAPSMLAAFQLVFAVLIAAFTGTAPAAIAEVCPPEVRSTGVSLAYNFAVMIFGGFAPFIATWLIASTGNSLSPAWYVSAATALSAAVICFVYRGR